VTYIDSLILLQWWSQLRLRCAGHATRMGNTRYRLKNFGWETFYETAILKIAGPELLTYLNTPHQMDG
jgi:hypothetical protein